MHALAGRLMSTVQPDNPVAGGVEGHQPWGCHDHAICLGCTSRIPRIFGCSSGSQPLGEGGWEVYPAALRHVATKMAVLGGFLAVCWTW